MALDSVDSMLKRVQNIKHVPTKFNINNNNLFDRGVEIKNNRKRNFLKLQIPQSKTN